MRQKLSANFYRDELECRCCHAYNIYPLVLEKLQAMRDELKTPLYPTSGTRCLKRNKEVGGSEMSDHLVGKAVDISCSNSIDRRRFLEAALKYFPTIGIKKDCLHLSIGEPSRVFTYD